VIPQTFPEQKLHIFQDLFQRISQGPKVGGLIVASASQVHASADSYY